MLREFDAMPVRMKILPPFASDPAEQHFDGVLQLKQLTSLFPNCLYDEIPKSIQ